MPYWPDKLYNHDACARTAWSRPQDPPQRWSGTNHRAVEAIGHLRQHQPGPRWTADKSVGVGLFNYEA